MFLRNLTNSPYEVPTEAGVIIVPAFDGVECEPTAEFLANLNGSFWAVDAQVKAAELDVAPPPEASARKRGRPRKTDAA